jgi:hypothetical protein
MYGPGIGTEDSEGRTVYVGRFESEFHFTEIELKRNGARYKLRERKIQAFGATITLWVLTVFDHGTLPE